MSHMKDFDIRIRNGGEDAIAAVSEYVKKLEGEVASARACAEMMLQGTGQKLGEELARRVMDEHYPPRWIPVDEQWPKHLSDVLVAYKCGKYIRLGVGEFDGTTVNDDGLTIPYFKGIGGFEVTHWMPLPEPPAS